MEGLIVSLVRESRQVQVLVMVISQLGSCIELKFVSLLTVFFLTALQT